MMINHQLLESDVSYPEFLNVKLEEGLDDGLDINTVNSEPLIKGRTDSSISQVPPYKFE